MKASLSILSICFLALTGASSLTPLDNEEATVSSKPPMMAAFATSASRQNAKLYEYQRQGGSSVYLTDYTPSLARYNFNKRASSGCFNGIWLLYEQVNYRYGRSWFGWGDNYCTNLGPMDNQASSARYAGPPDGYKFDTINFFEQEGFMGEEQYYYNDSPRLNNRYSSSIIVTGCSPWTIYEYPKYQGRHACVHPSDSSKCSPGFFARNSDFGNMGGHIQSARRGCYSDRQFRAQAIPENTFVASADSSKKNEGGHGFYLGPKDD